MQDVSVYILAGGKSSRMGEDKALKMLGGKPMLHYVLDAIQELMLPVYLLTNHKEHHVFHLPMIADCLADRGAAGGIDAMLQHSTTKRNIILCCDMPYVDAVSVQTLLSLTRHHDITVPLNRNLPEPLFGVYCSSIKDRWRAELVKGENKLSNLFQSFDVNYVSGDDFLQHNPNLFCNFNSVEDLNQFTC